MVGERDNKVEKILLSLDCLETTIDEAIEKNCDMIITHHPLIFKKPSRIITDDLLGRKIIKLIKNNIALYSSHTNLDSVKNGINDEIVKILGFTTRDIIERNKSGLDDCGIGRIVSLEKEINVYELINKVKEKLKIENLRVAIGKEEIKKIAIVNGSGQSYFNEALENGVDCIITGDTTYHYVSDYKELGLSIIDAGHFNTEWIVFLEVMEKIKKNIEGVEFIKSTTAEDPYEFI